METLQLHTALRPIRHSDEKGDAVPLCPMHEPLLYSRGDI